MHERESCVLCAVKHMAQARVLLLEASKGYEEHYFFALGHLAEAEDELIKHHPDLVSILRTHRKKLEDDSSYEYPFTALILNVAHNGEAQTEERVQEIEKEFQGKSMDDLKKWWTEMQS